MIPAAAYKLNAFVTLTFTLFFVAEVGAVKRESGVSYEVAWVQELSSRYKTGIRPPTQTVNELKKLLEHSTETNSTVKMTVTAFDRVFRGERCFHRFYSMQQPEKLENSLSHLEALLKVEAPGDRAAMKCGATGAMLTATNPGIGFSRRVAPELANKLTITTVRIVILVTDHPSSFGDDGTAYPTDGSATCSLNGSPSMRQLLQVMKERDMYLLVVTSKGMAQVWQGYASGIITDRYIVSALQQTSDSIGSQIMAQVAVATRRALRKKQKNRAGISDGLQVATYATVGLVGAAAVAIGMVIVVLLRRHLESKRKAYKTRQTSRLALAQRAKGFRPALGTIDEEASEAIEGRSVEDLSKPEATNAVPFVSYPPLVSAPTKKYLSMELPVSIADENLSSQVKVKAYHAGVMEVEGLAEHKSGTKGVKFADFA